MRPFDGEVSVFLFLNTRSLLFDPIDWSDLESNLNNWNSIHCPLGVVPQVSRQKFNERQQATSPPRKFGKSVKRTEILNLMSSHNLQADPTLLRKHVGSGPLKLLKKINKGDKGMATLGLFPHALKKLVSDKYSNGAELLESLSRDIVRASADRFRQYQILSSNADGHRQGNGKPNLHRCLEPLHFLEPLKERVSLLRSTCVCDLIHPKRRKKVVKVRGRGRKRPRRLNRLRAGGHKWPRLQVSGPRYL